MGPSEIEKGQKEDLEIRTILQWKTVLTERPEWKEVRVKNQAVKALWQQWDRFSVRPGVLVREQRVPWSPKPIFQWVMHLALRTPVLKGMHNQRLCGHLAITKTLSPLKARMYWPGIANMSLTGVPDVTDAWAGSQELSNRTMDMWRLGLLNTF